ncbi:MAG: efflux RND transporter periplasmic adaptor subunit [Bacteroidota bacterium]
MKNLLIVSAVLVAGLALALPLQGYLPVPAQQPEKQTKEPHPLAVTVAKVAPADFLETVLVTGSLVPREEILVGPEIEGLRVLEVYVDEGQRVEKGQVLARLVNDTLDAQLAQNEASLARSTAAIAQAQSSIVQAEARLAEARNAHERGKPLRESGYLAQSVMDQREAAARTAEAQLVAARDGLKLAEAERAQVEALRRELIWRRGKTEITAPARGLVSRRTAKVGATAALANVEPMFRIVLAGEIELEADVIETSLAKVQPGQSARVEVAGLGPISGRVRLVSAEVDRTTRLGRVRIFLGDRPELRVGAFARGEVETARGHGLAVPASAVLYGESGPTVQLVNESRIETRPVVLGLLSGGLIEVRKGLDEGDLIVAKSGTFLRDGDAVAPLLEVNTTSALRP